MTRARIGLWLRLRTAGSRCVAAIRARRLDRDFDEELATHLALLIDEGCRNGLTADEARRHALRRLGRPEQLRETYREQRGMTMTDALTQDIRYSVRTVRKSPVFTAVITLSLALGLGANTALFSLIDDLLLRTVAVPDSERLVQVRQVVGALGFKKAADVYARPAFEGMRADSDALTDIVGFARMDRPAVAVDGAMEPGRRVELISENYFAGLGVAPAAGRLPQPTESAVAVISHGWWRSRFGGEATALGKVVTVNDQSYEIVGVAPPAFHGLSIDAPAHLWITPRAPAVMYMVARIKPGLTPAAARESTDRVLRQLVPVPPEFKAETELVPLAHGQSMLRTQYGRPLIALMVLVALVLLITCTNVGNLLMVRNASRRRELSVRVALGARRSRLLSQSLIESLILAALGGLMALGFARFGVALLLSMLPLPSTPETLAFQVDGRVLGFTLVLALISALLFGVAPAWRATKVTATAALRASQGASGTIGARRLGRLLVACQVALSVVLLVGAGLFLQTMRNLTRTSVGFDADKLLQVSIDTRGAGYGEGRVGALHQLLLERVGAIPGVTSVTSIRNPIMRHSGSRGLMRIPGLTLQPGDFWDTANVGPRFLETMGIPLVRGRSFAPSDFAHGDGAFIVNEAWVRKYFPNDDPVARPDLCIVGVIGRVKFGGVRDQDAPLMLYMLRNEPDRVGALQVRISGNTTAVSAAIRDAIRGVHPRLFVEARAMRDEIARDMATERMVATTSAFFGALGAVLVSIGLFGVASYTVAQRTTEIGIRMALGASAWSVIRESLRDTMWVFAVGLIAGTMAAIAAVRFTASLMSDLLFGLTATDALNIAGAVIVMILVACAACIIPARHATKVDPLAAIRCE
jgi:macrolide transport system ATP-binding/permease protein